MKKILTYTIYTIVSAFVILVLGALIISEEWRDKIFDYFKIRMR